MSDTTRVQLAYIKETTFNTKKTGSALQIIRKLSEDLALQSESHVSGEMNSDRQTSGIRRVRFSTAGPVNFEFSYGTYDDWLASAIQDSAWASAVTVTASTISASSVDNSFSDSGSGFGSLVANQWIYASGFTNAANNGFFKIATKAAGKITVTGGTLVTESAGSSRTITMGGYIENGTTLDTYNLERTYADLSSELALFLGQAINRMSLSVPLTGAVTGAFDFIGASESSITSSGGSGYTAATTSRPFTSLDVTNLLENAAAMQIRSFQFSLDNQLHQRLIAGPSGVLSIGSGPIKIEGSIEAYYASKTLYEKYVNETASSLALCLTDPDGNRYVIEFPRVAYSSANRSSAQNPDVMTKLNFAAYKHPTELVTVRVARFPVA